MKIFSRLFVCFKNECVDVVEVDKDKYIYIYMIVQEFGLHSHSHTEFVVFFLHNDI